VDDIQSWSTNEITINWNSALGWVTTFLVAPDAPAGSDAPAAAGDGSSGSDATPWVAVALVVLAVGALVWWFLRRRATTEKSSGKVGD
jgi:endoglucanase